MKNPAQGPTGSQPKPRCDDQPKDASEEVTIVDLATARDQEADDCCGSCLGQWRLHVWQWYMAMGFRNVERGLNSDDFQLRLRGKSSP